MQMERSMTAAFFIVGWRSDGASSKAVTLMLAAYCANWLTAAGAVEVRIDHAVGKLLRPLLDKVKARKPVVEALPSWAGAFWVQPVLIVDVKFAGWSADGTVTDPICRGLSHRQDNADVCRIEATL